MNEVEEFRKQLIEAHPKVGKSKVQLVAEDLTTAIEALDRITDNLMDIMDATECKSCLMYYSQMRGEMCSAFNALQFSHEELGEKLGCDVDDEHNA